MSKNNIMAWLAIIGITMGGTAFFTIKIIGENDLSVRNERENIALEKIRLENLKKAMDDERELNLRRERANIELEKTRKLNEMELNLRREKANNELEKVRKRDELELNLKRVKANIELEKERRQEEIRQQKLAEEQAKIKIAADAAEAKLKKEAAFKRFYQKPESCPPDKKVECANEYIRKRAEFEASYQE